MKKSRVFLGVVLFFLLEANGSPDEMVFGRHLLSLLPHKKTYVNITNDFSVLTNLEVHCKSKDDDLGIHFIGNQRSYAFHFVPNYTWNTQFYCSFKWGKQSHYFDVYIFDRDIERCKTNCHWYIRPYGPCLALPSEKKPYCFPWNDEK